MSQVNADSLLGLARSFMGSRILLTGAELDLFTLLHDHPLSADGILQRVGGDRRALTTLLDALVALGTLTKKEGRYQTSQDALLLSGNHPGSVLPMVLHAATLWHRWSRLTQIVRGQVEPVAEAGPRMEEEQLRSFIGAMHVVGAPQAARVVAAVDPGEARKVLDVGGASGTYTIAFLKANPNLSATLFDRPEVVEMARDRLEQAGLLSRVTLVGGDFYTDPLPPGHDLVWLSAIIHQNSPEQNQTLFRKAFHALEPGGRIVIRDHVMSPDRTHPPAGAVFAVNMLVGTQGGGTYTFEEIRQGLEQAGFQRVRQITPDHHMDGLVDACRPAS